MSRTLSSVGSTDGSSARNSFLAPAFQHSRWQPQSGQAARRFAVYKCVAHNGVAFRQSPRLANKILDTPGPYAGELVVAALVTDVPGAEKWLQTKAGRWLPLTIDGQHKFQLIKYVA